jgi:hypothetical protein
MKLEKDKVFLFFIPLTVIEISVLLFIVAFVKGWFGAPEWALNDFCEATHHSLVRHPVNTWSNLAFIAAGFFMAWQLWPGVYQNNKNCFT